MKEQAVALVTGASSGIGLAVAGRLAEAGYRVFGTSRKAAPGEIRDGVEMLALDVTDDESVERAVAEVLSRAGHIDLLVNNAGYGIVGGAEESSIDQAREVFDTNVFGVIRMTRAVLPGMRARGRGRIVNISSVLGFLPQPYMALYAATKHAIEGYSESLDHEIREFGIRVTLVEPAFTRTGFDDNAVAPDAQLGIYAGARRAHKDRIADIVKIADDPAVVAEAVLAAAADPKPRLRYPAGSLAKRVTVLRRFVPAAMFDSSLRKQNKLPA